MAQEQAFVGTIDFMTKEVSFCTLQVEDGILIDPPENPPVSDFEHDYSESLVEILTGDETPEDIEYLKDEFTGVLRRRFEFLR